MTFVNQTLNHKLIQAFIFLIAVTLICQPTFAQDAKFQKAMAITPKQGGIDYEKPGVAVLKALSFIMKAGGFCVSFSIPMVMEN